MSSNVIAIDGPAYVGKSQIAKNLSELTGFSFVNTDDGFFLRTHPGIHADRQRAQPCGLKVERENLP